MILIFLGYFTITQSEGLILQLCYSQNILVFGEWKTLRGVKGAEERKMSNVAR